MINDEKDIEFLSVCCVIVVTHFHVLSFNSI